MTSRRVRLIAGAIAVLPLLGYPLVTLAGGSPRFPSREECVRPTVEGEFVDVVFGRFADPDSAAELLDRVLGVGFQGTEVLSDGCGRWQVVLQGVSSIEVGREIQKEAATVDLEPTLELDSEG